MTPTFYGHNRLHIRKYFSYQPLTLQFKQFDMYYTEHVDTAMPISYY